jgi:hypothetical protein
VLFLSAIGQTALVIQLSLLVRPPRLPSVPQHLEPHWWQPGGSTTATSHRRPKHTKPSTFAMPRAVLQQPACCRYSGRTFFSCELFLYFCLIASLIQHTHTLRRKVSYLLMTMLCSTVFVIRMHPWPPRPPCSPQHLVRCCQP